ncbi:MAG: bifunctional 5,10-methylenetetrahydrofolate dehydrogenase/5,10-methenyltetrahydrofolate cyclohydrolase [Eubacteriales bacterium]
MELRGMPVVNALNDKLKQDILSLSKQGVVPTLAIVRVGEKADDLAYERSATKRFSSVGAAIKIVELPLDVTQQQLEDTIIKLNEDKSVNGIMVFRPIAKHLDENRIKQIISLEKDVDCMSFLGCAGVFIGDKNIYPPCTPKAVVELIDYYGIDVCGKKVVIVGRSLVVGKPLAMLLISKNATVTICHTKTLDLPSECKRADILIAAAGQAKMITSDYVKEGQIVIDVGINMLGDSMCGDVDYENVSKIVESVTPVPGGIGTVTTSVLLKHTVESTLKSLKNKA